MGTCNRKMKRNILIGFLFALAIALPIASIASTPASSASKEYWKVKEITAVDGTDAKEIIVTFDPKLSLTKGRKFIVKLRHSIKGNTMYRKLGEAKLKELSDYDEATCKVTKGGNEIYKAFMETPNDLYVE